MRSEFNAKTQRCEVAKQNSAIGTWAAGDLRIAKR